MGDFATISLWELMQKLDTEVILSSLAFFNALCTKFSPGGMPQHFSQDTFEHVMGRVCAFEQALDGLGAPISLAAVKKLKEVLNAAPEAQGGRLLVGQNLQNAIAATGTIGNILPQELGGQLLVRLRGDNQGLFDQEGGLFGDEVDDAFPEAISDISEAGKSIALQRYTAAVFHLMRAMESGVAVLAAKLNATVENGHGERLAWGPLVANIKPKIDALPKGADQDEWLKVHALLHSANRAYRTKTAHPKKTYDEAEALAAFHATKSFMQHMANLA